jgi:hypothetical protein
MDRRTEVERELSLLATKMDRLMDALAEGTAPKAAKAPSRRRADEALGTGWD